MKCKTRAGKLGLFTARSSCRSWGREIDEKEAGAEQVQGELLCVSEKPMPPMLCVQMVYLSCILKTE